MEQPVACYVPADLPRVVTRDFAGHEEEVARMLAEYGRRTGEKDDLRVQMACLKLARGSLVRLERLVDVACADFRDVLAAAEYPAYLRAATRAEIEEAICTDWTQLQEWLHTTTPQTVTDEDE